MQQDILVRWHKRKKKLSMLLPIHPDTDKNTSITDANPLTTLLNHAYRHDL